MSAMAAIPAGARLLDFNYSTRVVVASGALASMQRVVVVVTLEVELASGKRDFLSFEMDRPELDAFLERMDGVQRGLDDERRAAKAEG
mmetsp:Transcript_23508/g.70462  ORF Transcript_23508/g.70462 Transcript_23508/m.70462 type:complete len:88 (+) Transcript_23508:170-433(+)